MAAVITFSILFNIPRYLNNQVVRQPDGSLKVDYAYLGAHEAYRLVHSSILNYIFIYFLPVVILAVMTYLLPLFKPLVL